MLNRFYEIIDDSRTTGVVKFLTDNNIEVARYDQTAKTDLDNFKNDDNLRENCVGSRFIIRFSRI